MRFAAGAKLGPYEILAPLGAGGMGEVYLARDTKLARDVAMKVLPEALVHDVERMARFRREAQVLASLNHPNIATLHGLEESGGTQALVMELVQGATLAESIAQGPIPLGEALPVAKQIAEGLEYAHESGIIHRDLKPTNVKVRPDGTVKILDFGLAKALDETPARGINNSPTISTAPSRAGVILGTAAYMSPEQARGKAVDRRCDIWSFGALLFEMLSGKQAFPGEDVSHTLAAVIMKAPDWEALPANQPTPVLRLLHRCLTKDPKQRLQAIGEVRIAIEETLSGAGAVPLPSPLLSEEGKRAGEGGKTWRRALPWALATAFLGAGVAALIATTAYYHLTHAPGPAIISEIPPPSKSRFIFTPFSAPAPELSPDGTRLAFVASGPDGIGRLWVRALDSPLARPLEGTEGAVTPFWSPDSGFLAFFAGGRLKKVDLAGGGPVDFSGTGLPRARGGSWSAEGTILFAPTSSSAIFGVPAAGGTPRPVSALNKSRQETSHRWPQFLPDSRHFIYFAVSRSANYTGNYVGSLGEGEPKLLLSGSSNALYAPPGYLLFVRGGNLMAQRFDTGRLELRGDPMVVASGVGTFALASRAAFSASAKGMLAYWASSTVGNQELRWFDRSGNAGEVIGGGADYTAPRISPDGKQIAVSMMVGSAAGMDLWVLNLARGVPTRLTFNASTNYAPVWSPDGTKIAFASDRRGEMGLYIKAANGTGDDATLLDDKAVDIPEYWSSDGRYLAFDRRDIAEGKHTLEIWILPLFGDKKPFPFIANESDNDHPSFSPDGKWLAYTSNDSGDSQVYIVPFPKRDGKWQVSKGGGDQLYWRRDGNELFYVSSDLRMTAVGVREKGDSLELGNPEALFPINPALGHTRFYDVSADGKKFVIVTQAEQASSEPVILVTNWPALLTNK